VNVTLPDGTTITDVPDGTTRQQLAQKLRAAGRNVPDDWLKADSPKQGQEAKEGPFSKTLGGAEALLATVSSPVAALAGNVAGAVRSLTGGKYGTPEGVEQGIQTGNKVSDAMTYEPRTRTGQDLVHDIGRLFDDSKLAGMPGAVGNEMPGRTGRMIGGSARQMEDDVARSFDLAPKPSATMAGVGAAETDVARMRRERAASLPVPVSLSKGQATRDFEQQRFERESAKDGRLGQPLRDHFAQNNEQILANFDAWVDQTGATAPDLYQTGQAVDRALVTKAKRAKAQVNAAYDKARETGEMQAKVPTDDIVDWVEQNRSKARNAPVISTIEDELVRLKGASRAEDGLKPGSISINDMEELRKTVNEVMGADPTNRLFGSRAKQVIDSVTDGRGGEFYKEARGKRLAYAKQFEDHGIISKLLKTKPGSEDRSVALENVFNHSVLSSSKDDLSFLEKTLKEGGAEGEQAWREIQGQTMQHLRQAATRSASRDVRGNPIVSAAALDRSVMDLDRKGKLEILFGKQGAQALRDINDLAKDVYTAPPGSVNSSGTTSTLLEAMSHVPVIGKYPAIARALTMAKKRLQDRQTKKRIAQSLEQPE
jgi:hypothetical protein